MSTIQEHLHDYERNKYFTGHIYGNFSPFYATISVCSVFFVSIVLLNLVLGCCSKHRKYWQDRHTGNRWLVSIWSATPHQQPPLDFTELQDASEFERNHLPRVFNDDIEAQVPIHQPPYQRSPRSEGYSLQQHQPQHQHHHHHHHYQQQRYQGEELVQLQKRESDI